MRAKLVVSLFAAVAIVAFFACGSGDGGSGPTGGAVSGALDTHCTQSDGGTRVTVINSACNTGATDAGTSDYGPTVYNAEADDDDCKYHVKWTSTPVRENSDVTFTAVTTVKSTSAPATGAHVSIEGFLNSTHPVPNSNQKTTETTPGTYSIGPVRFDAPGQWTVRFHIHEECNDTEDSPHGHVAFYLNVP